VTITLFHKTSALAAARLTDNGSKRGRETTSAGSMEHDRGGRGGGAECWTLTDATALRAVSLKIRCPNSDDCPNWCTFADDSSRGS
jgi:hypothetical protein